ncbi:MAG TPA: DUF2726 domain-containing protein [Verrucomicrobiae bacterium]
MSESGKDRFPLLRKILKAIGLPAEAVDDIVERILDWLSTKEDSSDSLPILPFRLRDDFLSPAESSFYLVLKGVLGDRMVICPKVNLADLFFVSTGDHRKNRAIMNRVDRKHVDFLLCDPNTMRPLLGIELDDKSHDRADRKLRDELMGEVFSNAQLPLVRVPVKHGYVPAEIESALVDYLPNAQQPQTTETTIVVERHENQNGAIACPKCGAQMVLRKAKAGPNAGGQFWGCTAFPRCRTVLPLSPQVSESGNG